MYILLDAILAQVALQFSPMAVPGDLYRCPWDNCELAPPFGGELGDFSQTNNEGVKACFHGY